MMAQRAMFVFVLLFILLAITTGLRSADEGRGERRLSRQMLLRLDQFVKQTLQCREVPGLTLSVVSEQTTLLSRGYGKADIEQDVDVTNQTLFCVASLSKAFTSTLLTLLFHNSSYTLDTPIREILPGSHQWFPDELRSRHVTTRDLLLHRTGLPRYDMLWFTGAADKENIFSRVPCMEPASEFRTTTLYNNIMYALAGHVAEVLSGGGQTWEELVNQHILKPLGMQHTTFYQWPRQTEQQFAAQYANMHRQGLSRLKPQFFSGAAAIAPAIAVCSSGVDMAEWARSQLRAARGPSSQTSSSQQQAIIEEAMWETQQPMAKASAYQSEIQRPRTPVTWSLDSYGLGWYTGFYRGFRIISHYGSFPGFYSMLTLVPDIDLALFSSINGGQQKYPYTINSLLHSYVIDLVLKEVPWLESEPDLGCHFPLFSAVNYSWQPASLHFNTSKAPKLAGYPGVYHHNVFGNVTVTLNQTGQQLQAMYGLVHFNLRYHRANTFYGSPTQEMWLIVDVRFTFTADSEGQIASLTINQLQNQPVFHRWQHQQEPCQSEAMCGCYGRQQSTEGSNSSAGSPLTALQLVLMCSSLTTTLRALIISV